MKEMPFEEFYKMVGVPGDAYYADMYIEDFIPVSDRYMLLVLKIPQGWGGTHTELIERRTAMIEIRPREGQS